MSQVYVLKPDPSEARLGRLFARVGLADRLPEGAADVTIEHVEIHPSRGEWRVQLSRLALADDVKAELEAAIARHGGDVRFVTVCGPAAQPHAAKTETDASRPADVPPGEPPALEDHDAPAPEDDDAYMERVLELAQEVLQGRSLEVNGRRKDEDNGTRVLLGGEVTQEPVAMADVVDEERSVVVEGEVFSVETRELRSGRTLLSFDFTDGTDSLTAKLFVEENGKEILGAVKAGVRVRARGPVQYDRFTQELVLMPHDLVALPPKRDRVDDAEEKRVELHLHTKMSALDGVTDVDEVIALAAEWGHPAIAITDHGVVQAFPRAWMAGQKHGIKVLLGVEGYLVETPDHDERMYHIVLFAQNKKGLENLYRLVSLAHMDYFYRRPRTPRAVLQAHREGILVGSACEAGEVYQAVLNGVPDEELLRIASFYDYLEIQPLDNTAFLIESGRVKDREALRDINRKIVELGRRLGKPVVATGDVHFLKPEHSIFRQIVMAGHGFTDVERPTPLYLRTTNEMLEEFSYLGAEEARRVVIEAPRAIADSIEDLRPIPEGFHPPYLDGAEDEIRRMTLENAQKIYGNPLPDVIAARVEKELASIIGNGFASLYLIAYKLVKKSLEDGYLVGSRGSVGSSFVANMCGISEVNPLPPHYVCLKCHYFEMVDDGSVGAGPDLPRKNCPDCGEPLKRDGFDIPFETFLGFEGDKVPDIDLNFSGEYQARAHKFAEELFGKENIYRAGTIGTLGERTAYGYVRKFLEEHNKTARSAEVNRLVKGITGIRRTTGQHPGGLMVLPKGREIYEFTPIQYPANDRESGVVTTHFEFQMIHDQLVKLDMLGHDGPTVIRMLEDLTGVPPLSIPLDDPDTMAIFSGLESLGIAERDAGGKVGTLGIPEYGTSFVRQMLEDTRPKTFADLVRIMGLSHGTDVWLNNAQDLVRSGTVTLSETIAARDDIMTYLIRKGLEPKTAFKIMEQVRKGRGLTPEDEAVMKEHQVPGWYIESCKKISYLFPKAHAVAYAMMAFYTAYYKVHHPLAFYATYFTIKVDDCDAGVLIRDAETLRKMVEDIERKGNDATAKEKSVATVLEVAIEAKARGVEFLPIDLYKSKAREFQIVGDALLPPLASVPGIGISAAESIVAAREAGEFTSIEDLRRRSGATKTVIEALAEHGCLEGLSETDQLTLF